MRNLFITFVSASLFIFISSSYAMEPDQSQPVTLIAPVTGKPHSPKEGVIRVAVTGGIIKQALHEFSEKDKTTLSKAIAAAGGFAEYANQRNVKLVRKGANGKMETTIINVQDILKGVQGNDPVLQAGDLIIVPTRLRAIF